MTATSESDYFRIVDRVATIKLVPDGFEDEWSFAEDIVMAELADEVHFRHHDEDCVLQALPLSVGQ